MAERSRFEQLQREFAAHIRDPEHAAAPPDVEDRRMAIYRELFFNNVSQLLAQSFPVLYKILGSQAWSGMVRDWFIRHRAQTPLFLELPQEFLDYLRRERVPAPGDPPFLLELAHYEWVELALAIDEREAVLPGVDPDADLLDGRPALSPLAWPLAYAWPVHRISPEYQPTAPPPEATRLVVYRNPQDRVEFLEINLVTARLLELLLEDEPATDGRSCLLRIAAELGHPAPEVVVAGGAAVLAELRRRSVVLGAWPVAR